MTVSDNRIIGGERVYYEGPDAYWTGRLLATITHEQNGLKEDLFTVWDELHDRFVTVVDTIEDARRMAATVRPVELVRG